MHRMVPSSLQWQQRWIATLGHFTHLKTKRLYKMEDLVTINTHKLISRVKAAHVGRLCLQGTQTNKKSQTKCFSQLIAQYGRAFPPLDPN